MILLVLKETDLIVQGNVKAVGKKVYSDCEMQFLTVDVSNNEKPFLIEFLCDNITASAAEYMLKTAGDKKLVFKFEIDLI